MNALLAVDGGGTKTEVMLANTTGEVLAVQKYAGTNLNSVGLERAISILECALEEFSNLAMQNDIKIAGIYFGLAGGVNGDNQQNIFDYFKNNYFKEIPFSNAGDDLNAVNVGVKNAPNGIAVIAGTGSNVMLKKDGVILPNPLLSGWGYLFDNGASGFDFGRDAVIAAKAEYNGTGPKTIITKMLEEKLGRSVFDSLEYLYSNGAKPVASLAPIVFDAYRFGDKIAEQIIDKQIDNVAMMIKKGHEIIGKETPAIVGLVGGIFAHEIPIFSQKLGMKLEGNLTMQFPRESQIYGALMEAAKNAGVATDMQFLSNFHRTVDNPLLQTEPPTKKKGE